MYLNKQALLNSTIGEEAVTLATNAIVNDYNQNMGLFWAPVRRTMSKYGMMRKEAREMCKTARRRGFASLIDQGDQNYDWANSILKVGWSSNDMLRAMDVTAIRG